MDIYVSELPKDCSECPMCRSGNLKLQKKGRYIEAKQCVFGQYKYQTIDDEIDTCPLKPLTDRLAEERKRVVQEIREKLKDMDFLAHETELGERLDCFSKYKVLDILLRVERGE